MVMADASESSPEAIKKLPTNNPPDEVWKGALNAAEKLPRTLPGDAVAPPDVMGTLQSGDINRLGVIKEQKKAYGDLVTEQGKKQADVMSKWLENIHDTGTQSRKQMPALKQSLHILDHPELGLAQGPLAPAETLIKAARQNLGRIGEKFGIPGAETWAKMEGGEPNQILAKNIAALTLENLRGMLGPNSGQFRQYEMMLMSKALGGEELSPGAQKTVMTIIDRINDRNALYDEMASTWASKHGGSLDERFRQAVIKFDQDNPTFKPEEFDKNMKVLSEGEKPTPAGTGGLLGTSPPTAPSTSAPARRVFNPATRKFE
jgi:hypothetical protein